MRAAQVAFFGQIPGDEGGAKMTGDRRPVIAVMNLTAKIVMTGICFHFLFSNF
jgi:hypothetical protein